MDTSQSITSPASIADRSRKVAGWLVPTALLTIMPKCPMCLAAYVAMCSGIALPFSTAQSLRLALIVACVVALSYVIVRKLLSLSSAASRRTICRYINRY